MTRVSILLLAAQMDLAVLTAVKIILSVHFAARTDRQGRLAREGQIHLF